MRYVQLNDIYLNIFTMLIASSVPTAEVTNKVESMCREQVSRVAFSFQSALNRVGLPSHVPLQFSQLRKNTHEVAGYSTLLSAGVMLQEDG